MIRASAVAGMIGVLGCIALLLNAGTILPSYLGLWLFLISLPLGALPIVLCAGLVGADSLMIMVLRRMLLLLLPGALLGIPVMLSSDSLFLRPDGFPRSWMQADAFVPRMIALLVVWCILALLFTRRRGGSLSAFGLILHVTMITIAATDWVMSLQPGLGSAAFGLLLMASQMVIAAAAALLLLSIEGRSPASSRIVLATVLMAWAFLHLAQYLVVWSANLPKELTWYQVRTGPLGAGIVAAAAVCSLLAWVILPTLARIPMVATCCAGTLLMVQLLLMLWLVTPSLRGVFRLTTDDGFAVVGLGGITLALLLIVAMPTRGLSHAAT